MSDRSRRSVVSLTGLVLTFIHTPRSIEKLLMPAANELR